MTQAEWPLERADALVNVNMIHISPWETCLALLSGAARVLAEGAPLYLYGPMIRAERVTAASNLAFDRSLRDRDPSWGVRSVEAITEAAALVGLAVERVLDMPNNNTSLVLRKQGSSAGRRATSLIRRLATRSAGSTQSGKDASATARTSRAP